MIIDTDNGKVKGIRCEGRESILFAGIPYAAPPVGDLRWKKPQSVQPWEGVLECESFSDCAPQPPTMVEMFQVMPFGPESSIRVDEQISEDCLYLNVWIPANDSLHSQKLPVLVIIHGGEFKGGSGSVAVLDGANMAEQGMIVVTINYRLGILGFLAHPDLTKESADHVSGNYGILDQIAALEWVKANIRYFGGDPDNITVSGESAGSLSVNVLYESQLAKGLFARAAAQSGAILDNGAYFPILSLAQAEQGGVAIAQRLQVSNLAELRALPIEKLLEVQQTEKFFPIRDGYVWPESSYTVYENHQQNDVPLLLGSNSDEGSVFTIIFSLSGNFTKDSFIQMVHEKYGEDAQAFLKIYPAKDEQMALKSLGKSFGDRAFGYETYKWAKLQAKSGEGKVYLYYFDRVPPGSFFGAYHSSALQYLYKNLDKSQTAWEKVDHQLSETISGCLLNFVRTGDPNGNSCPHWENMKENPDQVMRWGEEAGMIPNPCMEKYALFELHDQIYL